MFLSLFDCRRCKLKMQFSFCQQCWHWISPEGLSWAWASCDSSCPHRAGPTRALSLINHSRVQSERVIYQALPQFNEWWKTNIKKWLYRVFGFIFSFARMLTARGGVCGISHIWPPGPKASSQRTRDSICPLACICILTALSRRPWGWTGLLHLEKDPVPLLW